MGLNTLLQFQYVLDLIEHHTDSILIMQIKYYKLKYQHETNSVKI